MQVCKLALQCSHEQREYANYLQSIFLCDFVQIWDLKQFNMKIKEGNNMKLKWDHPGLASIIAPTLPLPLPITPIILVIETWKGGNIKYVSFVWACELSVFSK